MQMSIEVNINDYGQQRMNVGLIQDISSLAQPDCSPHLNISILLIDRVIDMNI